MLQEVKFLYDRKMSNAKKVLFFIHSEISMCVLQYENSINAIICYYHIIINNNYTLLTYGIIIRSPRKSKVNKTILRS